MFAKFVLVIGGLLGAIGLIGAADSYVVRQDVTSTSFASVVLDGALADRNAREAIVDELTDEWIAEHPDRFALMQTSLPNARASLRAAIAEVVVGGEFRVEAQRAIDELTPHQDVFGLEEVTLDLRGAVDSIGAGVPVPVRAALDGASEVVLTRDLSRVSNARSLLRLSTIGGLIVGAIAFVSMLGATRSVRQSIRAIAFVGMPLAIAQPAILDWLMQRLGPRLDGAYSAVVTSSARSELDMPLTVIMIVFAVPAVIEVLAIVGSALQGSATEGVMATPIEAPETTNVHPMVQSIATNPEVATPDAPSAAPDWFDPAAEDRLAS